MNKVRLRRVAQVILRHPEHYDQMTWGSVKGGEPTLVCQTVADLTQPVAAGGCRSVACVAGWTVALFPEVAMAFLEKRLPAVYPTVTRPLIYDVRYAAQCVLELTDDQAEMLFNGGFKTSPGNFAARLHRATRPRTIAKIAADRIDHLIATGE